MAEQGILFSGELVRALLAGTKTVTRRKLNWPVLSRSDGVKRRVFSEADAATVNDLLKEPGRYPTLQIQNRFGRPGDRLWVRETWRTLRHRFAFEREEDAADGILFRADVSFQKIRNTAKAADLWVEAHDNGKHGDRWRPSIFMPRWASRITLQIDEVRIERLQEITEEEARAEGLTGHDPEPVSEGGTIYAMKGRSSAPSARAHFIHLWDELHGEGSWKSNCWVWRIGFHRVERGEQKARAANGR